MVSVVIPAYQSVDTIAECINSVLRQTYSDLELIVVDDGSTDGTGDIVDRLTAQHSRLHVIHQPNRGRSEARWAGVSAATGEWVAFVDSDDTFPPSALDDLMTAATNETDIVLGNGNSLHDEYRKQIPIDDFRHLAVRAEGTIGVPWGSLYRRKLLSRYLFDLPREVYNGEDYIFWLRLVFATEKPVHVVYKSVYQKGDDHTCSSFVWTADYCYRLNEYRKGSIPSDKHDEYLNDMLSDRIVNLFALASSQPRSKWKHSQFWADIVADMKKTRRSLTLRQRLFLTFYWRFKTLLRI